MHGVLIKMLIRYLHRLDRTYQARVTAVPDGDPRLSAAERQHRDLINRQAAAATSASKLLSDHGSSQAPFSAVFMLTAVAVAMQQVQSAYIRLYCRPTDRKED